MSADNRFKRKYLLSIALNPTTIKKDSKEKLKEGVTGGSVKAPSTGDLLSLPLDALQIEGLHIEATINYKKRTKTTSSPAKISIFNLSRETIKKLKPESTIILRAGYESDKELPVVFAGQIAKIGSSRRGSDKITTILASGAYTIQKNLRVTISIPKKSTYKQAIEILLKHAADNGLPTGAFNTDPQEATKTSSTGKDKTSKVLEDGYAVQGWLLNNLSDLCASIGYVAYVSVGKLYVEPKEYSKTLEVFTLTKGTVIGDIQLQTDSTNKLSGSTSHKSGIAVKVFLDGRITLDKKIRIDDKDSPYVGIYDIDKLDHKLAYEEKDWFTTMNLVYLGSVN